MSYANYVYEEHEAINAVWVLTSAAMIFFMQTGFAMLECGSVRQKNSQSILIKNLFDACVGAIGFWLVGYTFAFGDVNGGFIGSNPDLWAANGFNNLKEDHFLNWIFHFSYASTSATIVSGALAERCQLNTYVIFSFIQTSFIYPVVCAWNWGRGWLYVMGFHDFAGTATVHLVGGTAAFWGAWILGERYGKKKQREAKQKNQDNLLRNSVNFESGQFQKIMDHVNKDYRQAFKEWLTQNADEFRPWNQAYIVTGGLILWLAWMFFNGGSTYDMYGNPATTCMFAMRKNGPAKIMMNTFLSATISGIIVVYVKPHVTGTYSHVSRYDCHACTNGVLCGLVAITGCCDVVEPWFAFVIGIIAAFFYMLGCKVTELLKIDQPCESSAVHMFGGIWGCIATGLFSNDQGLFFAHGGGRFFGVQILGIVAIFGWVSLISIGIFMGLKKAGLLRIDKAVEIIGLDIAEMGGVPDEVYQKVKQEFSARYLSQLGYSVVQIQPGKLNNSSDI